MFHELREKHADVRRGLLRANGQLGDRPAPGFYVRLVSRYIGAGPYLHFGCGTGHLLRRLSHLGEDSGFQVSEFLAERARQIAPRTAVVTSMDHLPSNTLGCFTSIHMLGHLNDETAVSVLMTWRRVLGPGGRVLAVMPDPASTEQDLVKETVGLDGLEVRLIGFLQAVIGRGPVVNFANLLSTFGEHAAGWLLVGVGGAIVDAPRRQTWVGMGTAAFTAHAAAVVIKRVVRRPRPDSPLIRVLDSTPSRLSFPSAHAASTTAAATMLAPLVGVPLAVPVPVAMGVGRVLLGVHYPSDVLAGAGVGLLVGVLARRYWIRP